MPGSLSEDGLEGSGYPALRMPRAEIQLLSRAGYWTSSQGGGLAYSDPSSKSGLDTGGRKLSLGTLSFLIGTEENVCLGEGLWEHCNQLQE